MGTARTEQVRLQLRCFAPDTLECAASGLSRRACKTRHPACCRSGAARRHSSGGTDSAAAGRLNNAAAVALTRQQQRRPCSHVRQPSLSFSTCAYPLTDELP